MASNVTIKAIDSSAVHQIQSGQVIVDLCSVAKELVENSIDSGATAVDVRFKNQGLDSIEVQDNGSGIAPQNYESLALKHYTSKLSSYDDLSTLQTFGFRGEALSSLCALSHFSVVTCTQQEAPRATRLEFESSGRLKSTTVVSGQKGTLVSVEDLFRNLPVRRRELERNIKRDWTKVIGLLNQYACVQTGVKLTVSQQPTKGKRMVMFSTKGNLTTRDNIINVFGVKTMNALITLDLKLDLKPTVGPLSKGKARDDGSGVSASTSEIRVRGHVSRPTNGEGRQTPDRQMFYVNGRPCSLPQFAKVFNEVYRSYNSSQSPFIFADIQLDTRLYDVNVSPDKQTILLHDQGQMLDNLRESLIELFETQDITIPVAQAQTQTRTPYKKSAASTSEPPTPTIGESDKGVISDADQDAEDAGSGQVGQSKANEEDEDEDKDEDGGESNDGNDTNEEVGGSRRLPRRPSKQPVPSRSAPIKARGAPMLSRWLDKQSSGRDRSEPTNRVPRDRNEQGGASSKERTPVSETPGKQDLQEKSIDDEVLSPNQEATDNGEGIETGGRGDEMDLDSDEPPVPAIPPPTQPPAPPRSSLMPSSRPFKRSTQEVATVTIGDHTVTSVIGSPSKRTRIAEAPKTMAKSEGSVGTPRTRAVPLPSFGGRLSQLFSASMAQKRGSVQDLDIMIEDVEMPIEDEEADEEALSISEPEDKGDDNVNEDEDTEREALEDQELAKVVDDFDGASRSGRDEEQASRDAHSPSESIEVPPSDHSKEDADDANYDYVDEEEKKAQEDKKVQKIIQAAEATAPSAGPTEEGEKRSKMLLKPKSRRKDLTTLNLVQRFKVGNENMIRKRLAAWSRHQPTATTKPRAAREEAGGLEADDAEAKLALKITKSDFGKMRIIGQFNLGFIIAVREASLADTTASGDGAANPESSQQKSGGGDADDELFIIDQHASDEKYNFERLQASTVVQSQRLVQPKTLELTALEEEIVMEHAAALERNGFVVDVDQSGARPVGARCQLLSLPLSRETTFSLADLEELIFLLSDNPSSSATTIPRPSKVRKMFAMRACRSSIMIGRALSRRQMEKVVRHMGEMEKPWNCPHGRPTMRHLCALGAWQERTWSEGDDFYEPKTRTDWAGWAKARKGG
ncbi:hypothetical protein B0T26DRAFT_701449 [Lasiosphaeria miniovina]|uniref:DNA mismatch repair protein PMS1 n=1 Tax=Lasiosphaeria miniovina TaxID=1954250 RepID=A0AA40DZC5_9PEZI|nr:uncharacterized protein B0T26DRAFT_701449 [Lasiosphaeria miniovina]KAK0722134.1 hypothetical protein B0T26DRAFT_701449 [Lasiosphaeria miniovina]